MSRYGRDRSRSKSRSNTPRPLSSRVLEDNDLEEKLHVFKGPDEGSKKAYDYKTLKKITVNIIRKVSQKKSQEKQRVLFDPTTVAPVRRPDEGKRPIFQRKELLELSKTNQEKLEEKIKEISPLKVKEKKKASSESPSSEERSRKKEKSPSRKRVVSLGSFHTKIRTSSGGEYSKFKEKKKRSSSKDTSDHYSGHRSESDSSRHKDDHDYKYKLECHYVKKYERDRDSSPNRSKRKSKDRYRSRSQSSHRDRSRRSRSYCSRSHSRSHSRSRSYSYDRRPRSRSYGRRRSRSRERRSQRRSRSKPRNRSTATSAPGVRQPTTRAPIFWPPPMIPYPMPYPPVHLIFRTPPFKPFPPPYPPQRLPRPPVPLPCISRRPSAVGVQPAMLEAVNIAESSQTLVDSLPALRD